MLKQMTLLFLVFALSGAAQTLHGAGSAFPYALYAGWFKAYEKVTPAVKLHYSAVGSDKGLEHLIEGKADFAAIDETLTDGQLQAAKRKLGSDLVQIPTVLGAVVPIYKVDGVNRELKLTSAALAGIYLGKITRWSDPEIANANPGVELPDNRILVVHRTDNSDTTYIWTDYLSRISPEWKGGPGKGLNVKWPVGLGAKDDDGVEDLVLGPRGNYGIDDLVASVPNSIGYVQLHYAIEHNLPYGDVEGNSGSFVRATESSVTAAAAAAAKDIPDDFRVSLVDEPTKDGFPISSFTWILVPVKMQDKSKAKAMQDFLNWMLKEGQQSADSFHYARLPGSVVTKALAEVGRLQ